MITTMTMIIRRTILTTLIGTGMRRIMATGVRRRATVILIGMEAAILKARVRIATRVAQPTARVADTVMALVRSIMTTVMDPARMEKVMALVRLRMGKVMALVLLRMGRAFMVATEATATEATLVGRA
eukprot:Rmarinus@m.24143